MDSSNLSRRTFIKNSAAATATAMAVPTVLNAQAAQTTAPNGRLRLGFIGVGGRAQTHLDSAIKLQNGEGKVEIAAVCDVFNRYRDEVVAKVRTAEPSTSRRRPATTATSSTIRRSTPSCIATPDHWHARQTHRRAEGRQARLLRKADDAQRRRGARTCTRPGRIRAR